MQSSSKSKSKKMKAITRFQYGNPEVLTVSELDKPTPKKNEILVRVHATTVNRTDCGGLTGKPYIFRIFVGGLIKPNSPVPGTDFAGVIEQVGEDVTSFKVGDRVWGLNDETFSSQAQYAVFKEEEAIIKMPDHMDYHEVVACAEGAHYAYNFINKVKLKAGDKVLVNGATGAIGSAAIQICKHYGCQVTAVGNTKNLELIKALGADKIYNYEVEDFTKVDKEKYHFVFDAVGKSRFKKCKPLLLPGGVYISSELGPNAENIYLAIVGLFKKGKRVIFPFPASPKKSLEFIMALIEKGKFRPVIDRHYPMSQIQEAYQYVMSGQKTGNVIIDY